MGWPRILNKRMVLIELRQLAAIGLLDASPSGAQARCATSRPTAPCQAQFHSRVESPAASPRSSPLLGRRKEMTRRKGPRLWLRTSRYRTKDGVLHVNRIWVIKDGSHWESTGCSAEQTVEAERKLQDYLSAKHASANNQEHHETMVKLYELLRLILIDKQISDFPNHRTPRAGDQLTPEDPGNSGD